MDVLLAVGGLTHVGSGCLGSRRLGDHGYFLFDLDCKPAMHLSLNPIDTWHKTHKHTHTHREALQGTRTLAIVKFRARFRT